MLLKLELLRQCISKLEVEKAKLLKQVMEKDVKCDAKNTEFRFKVRELEIRFIILE